MPSTTRALLPAAVAAAMLATPDAHADRRIFGFTYPHTTLPQGGFEIEHYLDIGLNGWDDPDTAALESDWKQVDWRHQLEFEYGITDNLDVGLYNVFRQPPFGAFGYEGIKLRFRYRFGAGDLPINPALYLEAGYFGDEIKLEQMLILGTRFKGLEMALNLKAEQEIPIANNVEPEHELIVTYAIGFHFNMHVALSLEYYGKLKLEQSRFEYFISYLGPALSVSGNHFYWTVAAQPQLGTFREKAAIQIRSLFGIVF